MIVVRNVFQLKFGKAREAIEHWREGRAIFERLEMPMKGSRILTDVVGPFYTMVLEIEIGRASCRERV